MVPKLADAFARNDGWAKGMRVAARAWSGSVLAGFLIAGCAVVPGPEDDLAERLQGFYAERAIEEDGVCPEPEIAAITKRKVLRSGAEESVLRIRYSYFDDSVDDTPAWQRVLITDRPCTGFSERDFTLVRRPTGYVVTDMSGAQREGPSEGAQ